ncbi:hypothetical protein M0R45_031094 [Rubus argutus]|uniref:Prohibitin n=1 Tax=Rubus argutus TaxID=59490 RepID=A0AAW1WFF7_RUBAR
MPPTLVSLIHSNRLTAEILQYDNYILKISHINVYPEGTHLIIPWFERPVIYDVRARPHLVESTSSSRDLQLVKIGL